MRRKLLVAAAIAAMSAGASAQNVKIGIVTFLSGPPRPFGVPAKNAAEFVVESLNKGNRARAVREARLRRREPRDRDSSTRPAAPPRR